MCWGLRLSKARQEATRLESTSAFPGDRMEGRDPLPLEQAGLWSALPLVLLLGRQTSSVAGPITESPGHREWAAGWQPGRYGLPFDH